MDPQSFAETATAEPDPSPDIPQSDGGDGGDSAPVDTSSDGGDSGWQSEPQPSPDMPQSSDGGGDGQPYGPPIPADFGGQPSDSGGGGGGQPSDSGGGMDGSGGQMPSSPGQAPADSGGDGGGQPGEQPRQSSSSNHDLPGIAHIQQWLSNAIDAVRTRLDEIMAGVNSEIAALIQGVVTPELTAITGVTSIIGDLVQGLLNNLAPTAEVGQMVQDALTGGMPLALNSFWETLWHTRGDDVNTLLDHLQSLDAVPDHYKAIIRSARDGTPIVLAPIAIGLGILVLLHVFDQAIGPEKRFVEYTSNRTDPNKLPGESDLVEALFRGNISNDRFSETLSMLGFGDEARGILVGNRYALIDVDRILELWRRGVMDENAVDGSLFRLGLQGESAQQIKQLAPFLPSPSDLVHFMTRDAFFDYDDSPFGNVVRDFQLDFGEEHLPFDQFAKVGVSEDVVKWFWRSHWEIPGRHDANEMFFRGRLGDRGPNGDGIRVLERIYRAKGIEPRFIQPLIDTAFRPLGRIDIRRLVKLGQMDRDGAIEAYQQIGYNTDNATALADLAISLTNQESIADKEPFRSGLKQRITSAYINGTLSAQEATQALTDLRYHDDLIAQFISEADVERHAILEGHIRTGVQHLYTAGEWEADHAREYLASKGFSGAEIGQLFEWWQPIRELHDLRADHKAHKEATRADVLAAYGDDIIGRDDAKQHLVALGYTDPDAEMFLAHLEHQRQRTDVTAELQGIQAAFLDRQIDTQEVVHELDAIGITSRRRDALIRKWQSELDRRLPELPLAMVEKLAIAKLYTTTELSGELRKRHFSDDQVAKFMTLWGYEIEVQVKRAASQSQREAEARERHAEAEKRRIEAEQRREAAHLEAEKRHAEAEARRALADARRNQADIRRAQRESQAEHDRLVREAHSGRLSISRIRTAYNLGILSELQTEQLMSAIGLRPESVALEIEILNEQQRAKKPASVGASSVTSGVQNPATAPIA